MQPKNDIVSMTAQQLLDKGLHCYHQKNLNDALFYFECLLEIETTNLDLLYTLVGILQELKDYKKALVYTEKLIALAPGNAEFLLAQAENYFHLQSYLKSLPLYQKLHNLHPLNTHILQRMLTICTKQNNLGEIKKLQSLLNKTENKTSNSQVQIAETVELALSLVELEKTVEAKLLIESVLLFDRHNINANGIYGALLSDEGEYEDALYYLDRIALNSSNEYINIYIKCLKEVRGAASVIKFLKQRVKKHSADYEAKKLLSVYYYNNKEYDKSYWLCQSIKNKYQDDLQFSKVMAMSRFMAVNEEKKWMDKTRLAAAANALNAIYKIISDDEDIIIQLARYYVNVGEERKAYDIICQCNFKDKNVREWNKHSYFKAIRDRESFFNSYILGRAIRPILIDVEKIKDKIWSGESLQNKNVVILKEQGIGDEILFASNYSWVIEQAQQVDIFCSARLMSEYSRIFPSANFHSVNDEGGVTYFPEGKESYITSADTIVLSGDLPALYYKENRVPLYKEKYYFVEESKKRYWKERLLKVVNVNKSKVGLIWRSGNVDSSRSASYLNEREMAYIISALPEVEFFNCMYVESRKEVGIINKLTKRKLHEVAGLDQRNDFENTAAMLSCLDLLVGAYTATISLALAVGTPAVAYGADYIKEDGILEKDALYYTNASHVSLPIIDDKMRLFAIEAIIKNIKLKLKLKLN